MVARCTVARVMGDSFYGACNEAVSPTKPPPAARTSSTATSPSCSTRSPGGRQLVHRRLPDGGAVTNALGMAIDQPRPPAGTLIHSDQGARIHLLGIHAPGDRLGARPLYGLNRGLLR